MTEYIERAALKRELAPYEENDFSQQMDVILAIVDAQPAADVAPVRHGRWEVEVGMNFFKERNCPVCKKRIESNFWNYCPNCGARMGKEDEHE